jgi:dipeptidyl aminopeptidase/acylaminoacyl peptidase
MTCYLTSRDDRFATAVAGALISDLTSMAVNPPTLILPGDADLRCPHGRAQQWHTALRERGVPPQLVLCPGATHTFVIDWRPSHRIDDNRRVVDRVTA